MKALSSSRRVLTTFLLIFFILLSSVTLFSQDCEIYKFKAKHTHCVDDTFIARIWFKYENTSDQFQLWVNGADSGLYYYEDLPLWIGPLPADGMTPHAFMVEDAGIAGCGYLYTMDPVLCDDYEECEFEDVEVEEKDCENGEFYAKVDLENEGGSEQFQLWVNDVDYGLYYYEDVPLYLGPFPADGMTEHVFAGQDAEMADCGFLYTLNPVLCDDYEECEFEDVEVEEKDCENGEFYAKVDLENEGGSEQFQLWVNDVDYGLYYYEDVPLYIGPFPADGMTEHVFAGQDAEMADCGFLFTLDPVECEDDDDGDDGENGDAATVVLIDNLYPVPARDNLEVTLNKRVADKNITIEIRDMNGLLYHYVKLDGGQNAMINTESMKPGIYFIRVIENSSTVEVKKFLIK